MALYPFGGGVIHREAYLDLLRIFSVILVMLSHFVGAGSWAQVIPGVINPDLTALPLIDATQWSAYLLESFLFEKLQTQPAVLGVSIFFLITGYLMPIMCDRYSRKNFLLNRFFRIFLTLIAAVAMIGIFLFITEKITFGVESYLASITLTYQWVGVVPVMGVLWTLVVEVIFYFIAFFIGTFTFKIGACAINPSCCYLAGCCVSRSISLLVGWLSGTLPLIHNYWFCLSFGGDGRAYSCKTCNFATIDCFFIYRFPAFQAR